ncbi:DUF4038 domain-containing protein [Galbibacter sp. BG1]|uniref:apiosidase-like domain-containing protein n=1 Tax=Galbibacter sp. BG1 TaxID=1170699 RepID=UPI0015BC9BD4|nr:DUF4038 domain-containing protein [Galbibacter sp. BG1]QLE01822.1 DUF4038 domain-containing protein [Galbibacter sp. BG1]
MKIYISALIFILTLKIGAQEPLPKLMISENKKYISTANGKPFFWLGDTAWELFHRLTKEEVQIYLDDRKEKGFTVIQAVILAELDGLKTPNANGDIPLINQDPTSINEPYFKFIDYVLEEAQKREIYVALLPTWGDKFNKAWGEGPEIFTPNNAQIFGKILAKRYKNQSNIIWVLGGDRWPEDKEDKDIVNAMASGILANDKNHLITYHPNGGKKARDYFDTSWLDFDFFQTGHDRLAKDYQFVAESLKMSPSKPVINGEPRYENHPDRFKPDMYGWMDASDVRASAYWTFLSGGAGYTYGTHDIWQMFSPGKEPINYVRTHWKESLHLPGCRQLSFLKQILESLPWYELQPAQSLLSGDNPEDETHITVANIAKKQLVVAYTPFGRPVTLKEDSLMEIFNNKTIYALWFNPRDGSIQEIGDFQANENIMKFEPWSIGRGSDFLLILCDKAKSEKILKTLK